MIANQFGHPVTPNWDHNRRNDRMSLQCIARLDPLRILTKLNDLSTILVCTKTGLIKQRYTAAIRTSAPILRDQAEQRCSFVLVAQGAGEATPRVCRVGNRARQEMWFGSTDEQGSAEGIFIPSKWFTADRQATQRVPIFTRSLQHIFAEALAGDAGEPPVTIDEELLNQQQCLEHELALLGQDHPGIKASTRANLIVLWQRALHLHLHGSGLPDESSSSDE